METAGTAGLVATTPTLTTLPTVEDVLGVVLEVVAGVAVLLQPVEEAAAPRVPGVVPARAVELAVINHADTPSTTTSTPWRTITSKDYDNVIISVVISYQLRSMSEAYRNKAAHVRSHLC